MADSKEHGARSMGQIANPVLQNHRNQRADDSIPEVRDQRSAKEAWSDWHGRYDIAPLLSSPRMIFGNLLLL
jgi:hypothetical protein